MRFNVLEGFQSLCYPQTMAIMTYIFFLADSDNYSIAIMILSAMNREDDASRVMT